MKIKKTKIRFERTHPDQRNNEVYIGHANDYLFKSFKWKTKRKGVGKPIDILTGKMINDSNFFPVFIQISEYKERYEGREHDRTNNKTKGNMFKIDRHPARS